MSEIGEIVKGLSLLSSASTMTMTDYNLAREMVDSIDFDWSDPTKKILDPHCGKGSFLLACAQKLYEYGHTPKYIVSNMLYGNDIDEVQVLTTRTALYLFCRVNSNILNRDSEIFRFRSEGGSCMKFDLVLGNPPYQSGNIKKERNIGAPLWPKFIKRSMELLKDGGVLSYVCPATWMNKAQSGAWKTISQYDLVNMSPNVHEYFPNVDIPNGISTIVLRKRPYSGVTLVDGEFEIDIHNDELPRNSKLLTQKNLQEFKSLMNRKLHLEVFSGPINPSINSESYSKEKTNKNKYETYYSGKKDRRSIWCEDPIGHYGELKLVVACSGAFYKTMEITNKGVGRQGNYILGTEIELKHIKKLLMSNDSKRLCELMMYGRFNNALECVCSVV